MNDFPRDLRILIIEDDEPVRRILARIMAVVAADVTTAEHGSAGLQALQNESFDIVVTDLKMPGLGGLDVASWIHEHRPSLPVVVTSGFATMEDAIRIKSLGASLLRKPFTPDVVYKALHAALIRRRSTAACDT